MSTYDPKLLKKLQDPAYRLKLLQEAGTAVETPELPDSYVEEEKEEKPSAIQPDAKTYTITELRNQEDFQNDGLKVFRYISDNRNVLENVLAGEQALMTPQIPKEKRDYNQEGFAPDIVEFLRDEEYKLGTLFSNAAALENAPEDVLRAYRNIRQKFENSDMEGAHEWLNWGADVGTDLITDPVNLLSLLAIPFSGGQSASAKTAAQLLAKEGVKKKITERLAQFATSRETAVAAVAGGAWTGLADYGMQSRDVAVDNAEEVSLLQTGIATGVGAIAAPLGAAGLGAAGRGIKKGAKAVAGGVSRGAEELKRSYDYVFRGLDKNNLNRAVDPEEVATRDLAENGLGELVDREALSFDAKRLGFSDEGSDFIEGVFSVIDDPQEVIKVVNTYGRKEGLGDDAIEEMVDTIFRSEGPPTRGKIAQSMVNTGHWMQKLPAWYGGKVSTFLDPYVKHSPIVAKLQKNFRYDQQRSILGERSLEGEDYAETLGDIFGRHFVRYKETMNPVLKATNVLGRAKSYQALTRSIRGTLSGDEVIDTAALNIRKQLDDTAEELKDLGLYEEADLISGNYFPRLWNRKVIKSNQKEFKSLLLKVGEAKTEQEADDIVLSMLSKQNDFGDEGTLSNSFLSKRKFENITDDTMFEKFLDNDANNVLQSYFNSMSKQMAKQKTFGATNFKGLKDLYLKDAQRELMDAGEGDLAENVEKDLYRVWSAQTGEGVSQFGNDKGRFVIDTVTTATRIALLPLATLSSLTEVMLNMSRGGIISTSKHFGSALKEGAKILTYDTVDLLVKNHGLTRPQAFRKMQRFGIALDQSVADQVERLSGDNVQHWRKLNNAAFKVNLLEPWTKTVQLTSFNVGRDIISNNLKALAKTQGETLTPRLKTKQDELLELGVDIKKGLAWIKRTEGDVNVEDDFMLDLDKSAGRYVNEIILNPDKSSGLRSKVLSGNPFTTMLFQLTAYPSAFTNTVLKDLAKRTTRNIAKGDAGASAQVVGTVLALQAGGMLNNYARNSMFNQDDQYRYKSAGDLYMEGAARWGGNGLYLDVFNRAKDSSAYRGNIFTAASSGFGPIVGGTLSAVQAGNVGAFVPMFTPGYGALNKDKKKFIRKKAYEAGQEVQEFLVEPKKSAYNKGGEVLDVPNVPTEPDQRIDKVTGRPYNQQAGAAFTDQEDRQDPLQRMGFGRGGYVFGGVISKGVQKIISKPLSQVIKEYSKGDVSDEVAEEAAEKILYNFKGFDDMPGIIDIEPEIEDYIKLETKALLEEKHDLSMDQIKEQFPEFINKKGELVGGEEFSKARKYTPDEIETNTEAGKYEDAFEEDTSDIRAEIQDVLDALKLTQKDKKDLNALLLKQANVKSVRAPKKKGGKVLRSLYANGSKVTTKGRKVYKDKEGQSYSERTETVQLKNGKWVNYPTVDRDGNKIPEELFEKLVESQVTKEGVVDFITGETLPLYNDVNTAVEAAKRRSKSLLNKDK